MDLTSSYFIESVKLGVLEHQLHTLVTSTVLTKRSRQAEFRRFRQIIVGLKLIPAGQGIIGLALGVRKDGTPGLFVLVEPVTKLQVPLPGASIPICGHWVDGTNPCMLAPNHPGEHKS